MSIFIRPLCSLALLDSNVFDHTIHLQPFQETHLRMKNYGITGQYLSETYTMYMKTRSSKFLWEELQMNKDLYFQCVSVTNPKMTGHIATQELKTVPYTRTVHRDINGKTVFPKVSTIEIQALQFEIKVPESRSVYIRIRNSKGKIVYKSHTSKHEVKIPIDLSPYGVDVYEIWINNSFYSVFLGTNEKVQEHCHGIIQVHMKTVVQMLQKQRHVPKFNIPLKAFYKNPDTVVQDQKRKEFIVQPKVNVFQKPITLRKKGVHVPEKLIVR